MNQEIISRIENLSYAFDQIRFSNGLVFRNTGKMYEVVDEEDNLKFKCSHFWELALDELDDAVWEMMEEELNDNALRLLVKVLKHIADRGVTEVSSSGVTFEISPEFTQGYYIRNYNPEPVKNRVLWISEDSTVSSLYEEEMIEAIDHIRLMEPEALEDFEDAMVTLRESVY